MATKSKKPAKKTDKKAIKKTTAKKAVKKTSSKTPAKKTPKKASPKKSVAKTATAKKSVKSAGKKTTVKSSPKNVTTKSPKAAKNASKTTASSKAGGISGSTFLFTGTLSGMQRKEAEALVKANGGSILSGVSAKLNYLVAGADAGSKLAKAKVLKTINILNESEFLKMASIGNSNASMKTSAPSKSSMTESNKISRNLHCLVLDYEAFEHGISEEDIEKSELNNEECSFEETWECSCYRCARNKLASIPEDHSYIDANLFQKLPVAIINYSVLNKSGIYVLRHFLTSELNAQELFEKYQEVMMEFCEHPDWSILGSRSFSLYDSPSFDQKSIQKNEADKFKDFDKKLTNRIDVSMY